VEDGRSIKVEGYKGLRAVRCSQGSTKTTTVCEGIKT
jgi:hypothetical protein